MRVAKVGRNTAVKAKAVPAVNGLFCCRMDHGGGNKVGSDSTAAVDNRQQRQQQSGNNQLKGMVASKGVDSYGGDGKQRWLMVIGSKMPTAKQIVVAPPTPLSSSSAGGSWPAVGAAARE
jgi:hypothetical protein